MSLREKFLGAVSKEREFVECPELGMKEDGKPEGIWVATINGEQFQKYLWWKENERKRLNEDSDEAITQWVGLIIQCGQDEAGADLFTEADAPAMRKLPTALLWRAFDAARRLNGIGDEPEKN